MMMQTQETPREAARRFAADAIRSGFQPRALHAYTDVCGKPLYWRIRLKHPKKNEKWIRPFRFDGQRYVMGEPEFADGTKPLYMLHELTARPDEEVVVVEGEQCVDELIKRAVLSTTSGGVDSVAKVDWSVLAGRSVAIWADNDEPGQRYAAEVAAILCGLGCKVRRIDVAALGLEEKGDAVNWFEAHPDATGADVLQLPCVPENTAGTLATGPDTAAWPDPVPLPDGLPPVQPFDPELLPESFRAWIMDIANRMQCPPDFPAVGAVVVASSLIGARAVVQPKARDDWRVVPNLWGLIVGRPGVMKSPALSETLKPLHRLQSQEFERWQAAHEAWAIDAKLAELQGADAGKRAKGLAGKNPREARALLEQVQNVPEEPAARRFIVNDSTVEKLGELLKANPWGTLCYRDELYGLLTGMDKQGQGRRAGFLLASV